MPWVWPWLATVLQIPSWTIPPVPSFPPKELRPICLSLNPKNLLVLSEYKELLSWGWSALQFNGYSIDQQDWKWLHISYQPITWYDILRFAYIRQSLFLEKSRCQASWLEMGPVGGSFTWASSQDSASQGRNHHHNLCKRWPGALLLKNPEEKVDIWGFDEVLQIICKCQLFAKFSQIICLTAKTFSNCQWKVRLLDLLRLGSTRPAPAGP